MNKKIIKKFFLVLTIMLITASCLFTVVHAAPDLTKINPNDYKPSTLPTLEDEVATLVGNVVSGLGIMGVVVAIISLTIMGIRWLKGSADEKAEFKEAMIKYIIGFALLFGTSTILIIVGNVANMFMGAI